jgi:hypothetical protein
MAELIMLALLGRVCVCGDDERSLRTRLIERAAHDPRRSNAALTTAKGDING